MLKVLLIIDCDFCRRLFRLSHFASNDTLSWHVHGDNLLITAESEGWESSPCGNFHYCPGCCIELEAHERALNG